MKQRNFSIYIEISARDIIRIEETGEDIAIYEKHGDSETELIQIYDWDNYKFMDILVEVKHCGDGIRYSLGRITIAYKAPEFHIYKTYEW